MVVIGEMDIPLFFLVNQDQKSIYPVFTQPAYKRCQTLGKIPGGDSRKGAV